jgi:5'-nucleotidase
MKYRYVLFDADETLFRFDIMAGLVHLFKQYKIPFTQADFNHYQLSNKQLWIDYQNGLIDAEFLQVKRFTHWSEKLNIPAKVLNDQFLDAMGTICKPLPGAVAMLTALQKHAKLGIVTNGFARMQEIRLRHTKLDHMFDWLVISEVVGVAKPNIAIFEHTMALMGNPPKNEILMVGDNAASDIIGGRNAGIDTCWLQHPGEQLPADVNPTHKITDLTQLTSLLGA